MSRIPPFFRRIVAPAVILACSSPLISSLHAQASQQGGSAQKNELSEKFREVFAKIPELFGQQKWDEILTLLNGVAPSIGPESRDMAILLDTKAIVYAQREQYALAMEPWETALRLSDKYGYFEEKKTREVLNYLARLLFSESLNTKDKAVQQQYVARAAAYEKRYLALLKNPSADDMIFYAQVLYGQAMVDEKNPNVGLLREARKAIEESMLMAIQPKESSYQLLIGLLQQEGETTKLSDLLEVAVSKFPQKKDFWALLFASYLQLAQNEKDPIKLREYNIRAINTLERAQSLGFLNTPKDNYNRVAIYTASGQLSMASEILHQGLRKGSIESTADTWMVLASQYQQEDKPLQALEALGEAAKLFPKNGTIELQLGEIYRSLEKTKEARDHYRAALEKGGLAKPHVAYQLLAYASMELDDWAEAQRAINKAAESPDFQKDPQMKGLKDHIDRTVADRQELQRQKEEAQKKGKNF
jgi:tetratricopeptide (TPR) repeat protein